MTKSIQHDAGACVILYHIVLLVVITVTIDWTIVDKVEQKKEW